MVRTGGRWAQATTAALALLALAMPRLITAAPLDLLSDVEVRTDPAEDSRRNFPGSAFFFAQGMIDQLPAPALDKALLSSSVKAAPATIFRGVTPLDSYRALNCLTSAIYYEAGNEPEEGQRAVAQVVLNRVRSPAWPRSICAVVYQGSERTDRRCQFTFSCDGSMSRQTHSVAWTRARAVAKQALAGRVYAPVGLSTFYHTLAVRPGWAASVQPIAVVGAHIFYQGKGAQGSPASFRMVYSGREYQSGPAIRDWLTAVPVPLPGRALPLAPSSSAPLARPILSDPSPQAELPPSTIRPEYQNSGRPKFEPTR